MRSKIYHLLESALLSIKDNAGNTIFQHVNVWNNQLTFAEEEQPFYTPAVFIEFSTINWESQLRGVIDAEVNITLHFVTDSRVGNWSDALEVFDLIDKVPSVLAQIQDTGDKFSISSFTRISSTSDHDFDELQDNIEVYRTHIQQAI